MIHQTEFQRPQLQKGIGKAGLFSLVFGTLIGLSWVTAMGSWLSNVWPLGAILTFALRSLLMFWLFAFATLRLLQLCRFPETRFHILK